MHVSYELIDVAILNAMQCVKVQTRSRLVRNAVKFCNFRCECLRRSDLLKWYASARIAVAQDVLGPKAQTAELLAIMPP